MRVMTPIMSRKMGPGRMADLMPDMMEDSFDQMQSKDIGPMMRNAILRRWVPASREWAMPSAGAC